MCGLVGFIAPGGFNPGEASANLKRMSDAMERRGPDDSGQWLDKDVGVGLAHRRLAVIDVTAAGHQPMTSASGRFIVVFNGEIYNHLDLRQEIGVWSWRGHSDTETLLAAIETWGLEAALQRAVGMFAIAVWDRHARTLSLARDRLGEKPLYYGWQTRTFFFASELKAIRKHPAFVGEIDRGALACYVTRGYVPSPLSIYAGISKLVPGSILTVNAAVSNADLDEPRPYWSLGDVVRSAREQPLDLGPREAVEGLETVLTGAIRQQRIADVPLGAFLSGGIDSSTVVALMQATSPHRVKTFTIGFNEQGYDEATHARAVAAHLKTDHTELYLSADDARAIIPALPVMYDEPFADSSQIATALVSRLAREHVTVALSGDGGDELFCGYGRYAKISSDWRLLSILPLRLRSLLRSSLPAGPLRAGIASESIDEFYEFNTAQWKGFPGLVLGAKNRARKPMASAPDDARERMMYADALEYLPDDILVKVDRASMAASLETRVPLLDHRVVEYAWRMPITLKYKDGIGKWPLKQILYKYVPEALVSRPKMGFGVPVGTWLRGPLKGWVEELLSEDRLRREGFFDSVVVRKHWEQHKTGQRDRHYGLWAIIMFQAWYDNTTA